MTPFSPTPSSETLAWFREAVKQAPEASPLSDPIYRHAVIRARCDLREADEAFQAALLLARHDAEGSQEHLSDARGYLASAAKELGYKLVPVSPDISETARKCVDVVKEVFARPEFGGQQ